MWTERCEICHESTNTVIREEDHNTLNSNVSNIIETHDGLPLALETHRGKVDLMSSDLLWEFLHDFYAVTHDRLFSSNLSNHTLNASTHCRSDITLDVLEQRDVATKKNTKSSLTPVLSSSNILSLFIKVLCKFLHPHFKLSSSKIQASILDIFLAATYFDIDPFFELTTNNY